MTWATGTFSESRFVDDFTVLNRVILKRTRHFDQLTGSVCLAFEAKILTGPDAFL